MGQNPEYPLRVAPLLYWSTPGTSSVGWLKTPKHTRRPIHMTRTTHDETAYGTPVFCVLCFEEEPVEAADALGAVMRGACHGIGCTAHDDPLTEDWGGPACTTCFLRELEEHAQSFDCAHARLLLRAANPRKRKRAMRIRAKWATWRRACRHVEA